jgi:hypothetical protein
MNGTHGTMMMISPNNELDLPGELLYGADLFEQLCKHVTVSRSSVLVHRTAIRNQRETFLVFLARPVYRPKWKSDVQGDVYS